MVTVRGHEYLRLVPQPTEGDRVDESVAIALEDVTGAARTFVIFGV
jgi:hypothetical protein